MVELIRTLNAFGEPLGFLWLLTVLSAAGLAWRRRWRIALIPTTIAMLGSLLGSTHIVDLLITSWEEPYARSNPVELPSGEAVIMLGGTHRVSAHDVFGFDAGEGWDRALTAVEIMRQGKAKALVLGGGNLKSMGNPTALAPLLGAWITAWGLSNAPIHYLLDANDTHQEALCAKELAEKHGWKQLVLVTSALHMRRAEALFKKAGLQVIPVACDFQCAGVAEFHRMLPPVPDLNQFRKWNLFLHEWLGWWVYRAKGWI
jgi:uncharacterized SAM-binding protein YcdF (DUF218 family)